MGAVYLGVTTHHYLVLSALLFGIGMAGFLYRRNVIVMFMCVELMLNAVNLTIVAFAAHHGLNHGTVYALLIIAVAAAEAAVGLAIIISIFRLKGTLDVDEYDQMKG